MNSDELRPQGYVERTLEVAGWPVRLTSYALGESYHCIADNVSPGAVLARATGATREDAERKALERAEQLLRRTRRVEV